MSILATPYRNDSLGADLRYEDLLVERREELPIALAWSTVRERRIGRIAAGSVGLAGAALMILTAISMAFPPHRPFVNLGSILLGSWVAMLMAYRIGCVWAKRRYGVPAIPERSRDPRLDEVKLERPLYSEDDRDEVDRRELWSVALPLIAIALLAPLTIHACVFGSVLVSQGMFWKDFWEFDKWILMSLMVVGQAHIVLACLSYRFAQQLRDLPTAAIEVKGKQLGWRSFWWTVVASALPGALAFLIPPILTLLTGLLFVPAMFRFMRRRVIAEREALGI